MSRSTPSVRASARLIAFYLPQYYPTVENDKWWGKGFTEWTNVTKARPLFRNHYQPRLPGELGFYDLRVPETRAAQAELARDHGIEGFCYWHYWFAGKRLLDRPFREIMQTREPDFPFCLAWANESWRGIWYGAPERILQEQSYPGRRDHERHFNALLPAFTDDRYLTVDKKPIFLIYKPEHLVDPKGVTDQWREMAARAGLPGLHLIATVEHDVVWEPADKGFDAIVHCYQSRIIEMKRREKILRLQIPTRRLSKLNSLIQRVDARANEWERRGKHFLNRPAWIFRYEDALSHLLSSELSKSNRYPTLVPDWDNTARCGSRGLVLHGSTPELFARHAREARALVAEKASERRIIFIKSWNEWAEGNYLEPDQRHGRRYLEALRTVFAPERQARI